jgi:P4 family phage/plasmid primase-like protien
MVWATREQAETHWTKTPNKTLYKENNSQFGLEDIRNLFEKLQTNTLDSLEELVIEDIKTKPIFLLSFDRSVNEDKNETVLIDNFFSLLCFWYFKTYSFRLSKRMMILEDISTGTICRKILKLLGPCYRNMSDQRKCIEGFSKFVEDLTENGNDKAQKIWVKEKSDDGGVGDVAIFDESIYDEGGSVPIVYSNFSGVKVKPEFYLSNTKCDEPIFEIFRDSLIHRVSPNQHVLVKSEQVRPEIQQPPQPNKRKREDDEISDTDNDDGNSDNDKEDSDNEEEQDDEKEEIDTILYGMALDCLQSVYGFNLKTGDNVKVEDEYIDLFPQTAWCPVLDGDHRKEQTMVRIFRKGVSFCCQSPDCQTQEKKIDKIKKTIKQSTGCKQIQKTYFKPEKKKCKTELSEQDMGLLFSQFLLGKIIATDGKRGYVWDDNTLLWRATDRGGMIRYASRLFASNRNQFPLEMIHHMRTLRNTGNVFECAVDDLIKSISWVDNNMNVSKYLLPIRGKKIIDLKTGKTRKRTHNDYFTFECPVSMLGLDHECPVMKKFIEPVFLHNPELLNYFQRQLGYCLTGEIKERKMFIWYGIGSNGKGAISKMQQRVLCGFYGNGSKDLFTQKKNSHDSVGAATTQLNTVRGKRVVNHAETNSSQSLNENDLKKIIAGDTFGIRLMWEEESQATSRAKLILETNNKPTFSGDQAVIDRIVLIPFGARFINNPQLPNEFERDPDLIESLLDEHLDEFFTWCVQGSVMWYKDGLGKTPEIVEAATSEYAEENNQIGQFIQERITISDKDKIFAKEMYDNYRDWCSINGFIHQSNTIFGEKISKVLTRKKNNKGRYYEGVRFTLHLDQRE